MFRYTFIIFCLLGLCFSQNFNIVIHCDLATKSHIKPILEISEELSTLGHKITFVATERNLKFSAGYNVATHKLVGPISNPSKFDHLLIDQKSVQDGSLENRLDDTMRHLIEETYVDNYKPLSNYIDSNDVDLMICDFMAIACQDIARSRGIPLIIGTQATDFLFGYSPAYMVNKFDYVPLTIQHMDSFFDRYYYKVIAPLRRLVCVLMSIRKINNIRISHRIKPTSKYLGDYDYGLGLVHSFFGLDIPISLPPAVKMYGPIYSQQNSQPLLNSEQESFLRTHNNTVYIGLGSLAKLDKDLFLEVFARMYQLIQTKTIDGVIWSYGNNLPSDLPSTYQIDDDIIDINQFFNNQMPHIKVYNWVPQQAILSHPNMKLFLSHGGIESIFETIKYKKPILSMGLFGDQPKNAMKVDLMGIGTYLNPKDLSFDLIQTKISTLLIDETGTIKMNLNRLNLISQSSSDNLKTTVKTVLDYVKTSKLCRPYNKFNPSKDEPPCELNYLLPPAHHMSFIRANALDIYAANLVLLVLVLIALCFLVQRFLKLSHYYFLKRLTTIQKNFLQKHKDH